MDPVWWTLRRPTARSSSGRFKIANASHSFPRGIGCSSATPTRSEFEFVPNRKASNTTRNLSRLKKGTSLRFLPKNTVETSSLSWSGTPPPILESAPPYGIWILFHPIYHRYPQTPRTPPFCSPTAGAAWPGSALIWVESIPNTTASSVPISTRRCLSIGTSWPSASASGSMPMDSSRP